MKNSFILYTDLGPSLLELKDAEVGRLTKAIYRYVMTGEITSLRGSGKICFDIIRNHLDRDQAKYAEICQRRAEAGRKGGLSSGKRRQEANADLCSANEAENEHDNKNENQYENGNDNGNGNENGNGNGNGNGPGNGGGGNAPTLSALRTRFPNVPLSLDTYHSLLREYPKDYEKRLRRLSDYLTSSGISCDDPMEILEIWAIQEAGQKRSRKGGGDPPLPRPLIL